MAEVQRATECLEGPEAERLAAVVAAGLTVAVACSHRPDSEVADAEAKEAREVVR